MTPARFILIGLARGGAGGGRRERGSRDGGDETVLALVLLYVHQLLVLAPPFICSTLCIIQLFLTPHVMSLHNVSCTDSNAIV